MATMTAVDKIFLGCAVFGGALFAVRVALFFFVGHAGTDADTSFDGGADVHADFGTDVDADADVHTELHHGGDSDTSFKLLTFQGITAFLMMFGLVGLAMRMDSSAAEPMAILAASMAGLLALYVVGKLFAFMRGLQSSGTVDLRNAVGQEGSVYLTIHAGGTGQVRVTVQDRLRIYEAVADGEGEIRTGESVKVVNVLGGKLLVVQKQ
jgi:membrane protein implicated in regulation of membrane protease activity